MEFRAYPISERYEQYEQRAQRLSARIQWIKRHFILLLLAASLVLGLLFWFLGSIGNFTKPLQCDDSVYGEPVQPSSGAFLCKPKYEFLAENSDIWSQDMPVFPGNYRVRAYTKNLFGKVRYSQILEFSIAKRPVQLSIPDSTYFYGDMSEQMILQQVQVQGLADGDHLADATVSMQHGQNGTVYAQLDSFILSNDAGIMVNDCYLPETSGGTFTMLPRPITIATQEAQKEYDGAIWQEGSAAITDGNLVNGDTIQIQIPNLPAEAGTYEIDASYRILSQNVLDVTALYNVTLNRGKLTVQPRKLTITTGSARKVYDGKDLSCQEWALTEGQVLQGHTLQVDMISKRKNYGESPNEAKITVTDAFKSDVSANYDVKVIHGKLTVDPIVLKIKTESATKVYDGSGLVAPCYLAEGSVLKGHNIFVVPIYGQVEVGSRENIPDVIITDKRGNDVKAEGYRIELDIGILTVTPRPITVTSQSAQKLYDGVPLTCHKYSITSGSLATGDGKEAVSMENFTGQQTEVGSSDNVFNIFISSVYGEETTANYDITYIYGTLTVLENPDYQPPDHGPGNATIPDNGEEGGTPPQDMPEGPPKPGSDTQIRFPNGGSGEEEPVALIESIDGIRGGKTVYLRFQSHGDYTLTGWTAAKPAPGFINEESPLKWVGQGIDSFGNTPARIRLTRSAVCPVLIPNYTYDPEMIIYNGNDCYFHDSPQELELEIYPYWDSFHSGFYDANLPEIAQLEVKYRQYVYDHYLSVPETTRRQLIQWAKEHGIYAENVNLVQDIQRAVLSAAAYNMEADPYPQGVDVVVHFLTVAQEGICQHFASAATLLLRSFGIPARYTVGYAPSVNATGTTPVTSLDAHAWVEYYVDGFGWVILEVTPGGAGGDGGIGMQIAGYDATKYYDGKPFDLSNIHSYRLEGGFIRKGHRMEVTYKDVSRFVEPGSYELEVESYHIYDEDGKEVTDQYDITFNPGILTILPRPITIVTGSSSKQYDGLPLSCLDYWIGTGSLVPGHQLSVELGCTIIEPGDRANEIIQLKILDSRGRNVGKLYDISVVCGQLSIIP